MAYAANRDLNVMSDALAEKTAAAWDAYKGMAERHFAYLKSTLDRDEADYRD